MDAQSPHPRQVRAISTDQIVKIAKEPVSRRSLLKLGILGTTATTLAGIDALAWAPQRVAQAATAFSDIQFDIGKFVAPVQTIAGVPFGFGPVFTFMQPASITRKLVKSDQAVLANALNTIESHYAASPSGLFVSVSYGVPYFNRFAPSLVAAHMPNLLTDSSRPALEEAVPGPTDVSPLNPGIKKKTFNVPVDIDGSDILFTFRTDLMSNATDAVAWLLKGSNTLNGKSVPSPAFNGMFHTGTPRVNFVQQGLPRQLADQHKFSFASSVNPTSPMWMGFADQQVAGAAAPAAVTFIGANGVRLTTAQPGDYFDNGSIQHLSHVISDLAQFYSKDPANPEDFSERVQYMFRSKKKDGTPGLPFEMDPKDGFTNGGGMGAPTGNTSVQQQSAFLSNDFMGTDDVSSNFDPAVTTHKKYRVGHEQGLQRSSRAPDGTPLHIRIDGPGLSSLDIPNGSLQPTLEFSAFIPTAEFFRVMRINSASLDYVKFGDQGGTATSVAPEFEAADGNDAGLERFTTATRRQNFLIPPRRHRAFPLLELS